MSCSFMSAVSYGKLLLRVVRRPFVIACYKCTVEANCAVNSANRYVITFLNYSFRTRGFGGCLEKPTISLPHASKKCNSEDFA
jgi:hypothetical protein